MAYVNGNLALQPKRKPDQKQQNFRETRKVVVKRKPIPVQEKLLYMFTILVCVVVAGVIIYALCTNLSNGFGNQELNEAAEHGWKSIWLN